MYNWIKYDLFKIIYISCDLFVPVILPPSQWKQAQKLCKSADNTERKSAGRDLSKQNHPQCIRRKLQRLDAQSINELLQRPFLIKGGHDRARFTED